MLDASIKKQLSDYLQRLRHPLRLTAWLGNDERSQQMRELLSEVDACSDQIEVIEAGDTEGHRIPTFGIHRPDEEPRVQFAGLPMGHEFASLVLALLHVGGHPPREAEEILQQVRGLGSELEFETYFSTSCQNCPDVVQALNAMAAINPNVRHVAIDGAFFQGEVDERQIANVPTVFLNGKVFGQGRMGLEEILEKVDSNAASRRVDELNAKGIFDMLVVGGGPAGAAATIYAARKGIETGLVTERFGGQVLDTLAIENFISVSATEGSQLAAALEAHVGDYPVDVIKNQRATKLIPGEVIEVMLESGPSLRAKSVVLTTGARWRNMNIPGEAEYRNKGVTYCPHCDGPLFKGKRVAVIGGGNSGIEAAIDLAGVVEHVTVLEFMGQINADAVLERKLFSLPNATVLTHARTTEIVGDGRRVNTLKYEDRNSGEVQDLDVAGVFVQIGLLPNTEWLKDTVELSSAGEIIVDDRGQTSVPGVFAAGDATTVPFKQIIIASGDGAKAALGAFDYLIRSSAPAA